MSPTAGKATAPTAQRCIRIDRTTIFAHRCVLCLGHKGDCDWHAFAESVEGEPWTPPEADRAEADQLAIARDAARYRWLRDSGFGNRVPHLAQYPYQARVDARRYPQMGEVGIDAAIDAAMEMTK